MKEFDMNALNKQLGLLIVVLLISTGVARSQKGLSGVYREAVRSVVLIDFVNHDREVGSGIIVGVQSDGSALILTAKHVVEGYSTVLVTFSGIKGNSQEGVVDSTMPSTDDLAMIIVRNAPRGLEPVIFSEDKVSQGDLVGAIGHPKGSPYEWSEGTVRTLSEKFIFHSASVDVGSSGGPLLDEHGRVVGLNVRLMQNQVRSDLPDSIPSVVRELSQEGISISTQAIISVLDGWLNDVTFDRKWKLEKSMSFWEHLYKDPLFILPEGAAAVFGGMAIYRYIHRDQSEEIALDRFGAPPSPPHEH